MTINKILIALLLLPLFILSSCNKKENLTLIPYDDTAKTVQIINDNKGKINSTLYINATIKNAENFFTNIGFPPFIDAQNIGKKSMHSNGNVVYLYSNDNTYVNKITFRHFINGDFNKNTISTGINQISDLIALVLNRKLSIEERIQIREVYTMIIDMDKNSKTHIIQFDGIMFTLDVEPLSKTILCSYQLQKK